LCQAGHVALRAVQAADEAAGDRITSKCKHDWNRGSRRLGSKAGRFAAGYNQHRNLPLNELGCLGRQPLILPFRPAIFDRDILAFGETEFTEAAAERGHEMRERPWRLAIKEADDRHQRLLRASV
jgi:hypothetical protein